MAIQLRKRRAVRPYLLFELLIAFTLLSLFAVPFITVPVERWKKEMVDLEKIELYRLSELAFAEVKEQLYKHKIPLQKIGKDRPDTPTRSIKQTFSIDDMKEKEVLFKAYLYWKKPPKNQSPDVQGGLLCCDLEAYLGKMREDFQQDFFITYSKPINPTEGE